MTLVFDFDGTIHKTDAIYGYAVRKVFAENAGLTTDIELSDEALSEFLGVNAKEMWKAVCPSLQGEALEETIRRVGGLMEEAITKGESKLYDGIEEVLDVLCEAGHRLILLSNCTCSYMQLQREKNHLDRWFSDYYCSEAYKDAPKEEIFEVLRQNWNGPFVVVGDRKSDMMVGKRHHILSIGCAYGYGNILELQDAAYLARSPRDILSCVKNIENNV